MIASRKSPTGDSSKAGQVTCITPAIKAGANKAIE
jgi:hypothetical protein